jgi:hypothetical protein
VNTSHSQFKGQLEKALEKVVKRDATSEVLVEDLLGRLQTQILETRHLNCI